MLLEIDVNKLHNILGREEKLLFQLEKVCLLSLKRIHEVLFPEQLNKV